MIQLAVSAVFSDPGIFIFESSGSKTQMEVTILTDSLVKARSIAMKGKPCLGFF
jgi:hypothetical protein